MNMIVVPLSATPALPPPTAAEITIQILAHMLISGLPLGILVRLDSAVTFSSWLMSGNAFGMAGASPLGQEELLCQVRVA